MDFFVRCPTSLCNQPKLFVKLRVPDDQRAGFILCFRQRGTGEAEQQAEGQNQTSDLFHDEHLLFLLHIICMYCHVASPQNNQIAVVLSASSF